ncbi:hypothetical protein EWM64_g5268 [Hericium alpestre]|uniref:Alpha/beta hydrolase fold-3 domain-containing protein n=1 Tax=Hericium alpestre TaxID=135208 RepID=A0A4Y9ZZA4_9AGAM|nr:hypothetical protein EWM64_g5268 [Hericium alpestre]
MKALYSFLGVSASSAEFSPLLAASHTGLPPATVYICGLDPLRDEGLLYERVLREAGVKTKLYVYPGLPHGFHVVLPQMKAAAKYNADVDEGIKWLLSGAA